MVGKDVFSVNEGENQDDEDEYELHADLGVINQWPFHGIGGMEGVADCDEGDAGYKGKESGMDEAG